MKSRFKIFIIDSWVYALLGVAFWYFAVQHSQKTISGKNEANGIVDTLTIVNGDTVFVSDGDTLVHSSDRLAYPY